MKIARHLSLARTAGILAVTLLLAGSLSAQVSEQVVHTFSALNGSNSRGNLIADASGNLYGTTVNGGLGFCGREGCGTVFEMLLEKGGTWKFRRLYSFPGTGTAPYAPYGNLVFDATGNLYGTSSGGGENQLGAVYKLTPGANGVWTETTIHSFAGIKAGDGAYPYSGLAEDAAGNLYGTTTEGGARNYGAVYELTPNADGGWSETILYSFAGGTGDGDAPLAGVTFDGAGNLYGTTLNDGEHGFGTVFEMSPGASGWTETTIYNFTGKALAASQAPVWLDAAGNLYGTTCGIGPNWGAVFQLANSGGTWKETTLHRFVTAGDGACPIGGVTPDAHGNLYGTTAAGGTNNYGVVYEVAKAAGGAWTEKVLYSFAGGNDGTGPWSGLTTGKGGIFYGTTTEGGSGGVGVIYEIKP